MVLEAARGETNEFGSPLIREWFTFRSVMVCVCVCAVLLFRPVATRPFIPNLFSNVLIYCFLLPLKTKQGCSSFSIRRQS